MKFYPRDWRGEQTLRSVSLAARGLWMEMLCIMHEASPYGHLVMGGRAVSNDALARTTGSSVEEVSALLIELQNAGVLSVTRKAVVYSRRMVSDRNRAEKGRKAVAKRWAQGAENPREKRQPNRSPNRSPITQKPEARSHISSSSDEKEDKSRVPRPPDVPEQTWSDFLTMRKAKRAPLTATALAAIEREAGKAGWGLSDALEECLARGWQGFKSVWVETSAFPVGHSGIPT